MNDVDEKLEDHFKLLFGEIENNEGL